MVRSAGSNVRATKIPREYTAPNRKVSKGLRAQSAIEQIEQYGWVILIIVVIVAALWQSNVFHLGSAAQRAQPGSCRVVKAQAGGGVQLGLLGTCNLPPQYVAQFDGHSSNITIGNTDLPIGNSSSSFFAWIYTPALSPNYYAIFDYGRSSTSNQAGLFINAEPDILKFSNNMNVVGTENVSINTWSFVGWTYDGGKSITLYIDGVSVSYPIPPQYVVLDSRYPSRIGDYASYYFKGSMSDIQIYNTALTPSEVHDLYMEGIGGAAIPSPNLVGWWPLNGDTKDYSGNNNNGVPANIVMNESWNRGYSTPS